MSFFPRYQITFFLVFDQAYALTSHFNEHFSMKFYNYFVTKSSLKGGLYGLRKFFITESPLKMMKNAFYFTLKALFVLKIFKFSHDFLVM